MRYFASRKRRKSFDPCSVKTVLVVELTHLGDVIASLPTFVRLQTFLPSAEFQVLINQRYASLLSLFETDWKIVGIDERGHVFHLLYLLNKVREFHVDLAISMSPPRKNAMTVLGSRARLKLGYLSHVDSLTPFLGATPVESFGFDLPSRVAYAYENIYERPAKICDAFAIDGNGNPAFPPLRQERCDAIHDRMMQQRCIPETPFVVLHPFSSWRYREWDLSKYVNLGTRIIDELGYSVVISCDEDTSGKLDGMRSKEHRMRVVKTSDLAELAVLMKASSLIVGNDSGPLHLAAALGARAVGLFGPAPPELTAPRRGNGRYLYKKVECSPCDQRRCVKPEHSCMMELKMDDVFGAVGEALHLAAVGGRMSTNG